MGYELKKVKISDWAPNHPFAHEQISFVPNPESSSINLSAKQSKANSAPQDMDNPQQMAALQDKVNQVIASWDESTSPEPTTPESNEST